MKRLLYIALILLTVTSCAWPPEVKKEPGYELAVFERDIKARLAQRNEAIKGFEAEADMTLEYSGIDYRGQILITGKGPSSMRLDCLGPLDQPVLSLAMDRERFALISIPNMRYCEGRLSSPVISSVIPNGIKVRDIYLWFLGSYDFQDRKVISCTRHSSNPDWLAVELSNERSGLREEICLEVSEGLVRRVILKDAAGNVALTVESEQALKNGDFYYPGSVCLSCPSSGFRLLMAYKKLNPLSMVPAAAFSLQCPPGFKHKTYN